MAQNIYDQADFFAGYRELPRSVDGLAAAPEWPTLQAMLPPMPERRVLDMGCGFGAFARWARQAGAQAVIGVDLSENMLNQARALTDDSGIEYRLGDMAALNFDAERFDLIYSSLAFHYLPDFSALCTFMRRLMVPNGRLVFSVEHPVFTAPSHPEWQEGADGSSIWPLNNYLSEGQRVTDWLAPGVIKYHRSLAGYINPLLTHGFRLLQIEEWAPSQQDIANHPDWADEVHRPPFLLVAAEAA